MKWGLVRLLGGGRKVYAEVTRCPCGDRHTLEVTCDDVRAENMASEGHIPDITLYTGGKPSMTIEIVATHKPEEETLRRIKSSGIPCIAIETKHLDAIIAAQTKPDEAVLLPAMRDYNIPYKEACPARPEIIRHLGLQFPCPKKQIPKNCKRCKNKTKDNRCIHKLVWRPCDRKMFLNFYFKSGKRHKFDSNITKARIEILWAKKYNNLTHYDYEWDVPEKMKLVSINGIRALTTLEGTMTEPLGVILPFSQSRPRMPESEMLRETPCAAQTGWADTHQGPKLLTPDHMLMLIPGIPADLSHIRDEKWAKVLAKKTPPAESQ